jgi:hypothetical protein
VLLGIDPDRRPSETMTRRLLQAVDPDLLGATIGRWLAARITARTPAPIPGSRQAIALEGKTMRGSRTRNRPARHVLAAADQATGVVLASTDGDSKTNEITRFDALLDQIGDLRGVVGPADALHCQRDHVAYLAGRGARWILTVKGNQPILHQQLAGLLWRQTPEADRNADRGHGRREIRTLKSCQSPPVSSLPMRHRRSRSDAAVDCSTNRGASLRTAGATDIAAPTRHHARNANRPLTLLGIT